MSDDYYQPPSAEQEQQKQKGEGGGSNRSTKRSTKRQRLRPTTVQDNAEDNHFLFLLYQPGKMAMFRGVVTDPKIKTWWMKFFTHYIATKGERGGDFTIEVFCKKSMNEYYETTYGRPIIYAAVPCPSCGLVGSYLHCISCGTALGARLRDDSCPSCDRANQWWDMWKKEWSKQLVAIGMLPDPKGRYKLEKNNPAQYKEMTASGTALRAYQDSASEWSKKEKWLYCVFDLDKWGNKRALFDGEPKETTITLLFQGKTVHNALYQKHQNGKKYWSIDAGMQIVLTRNTSNGMPRTEYSLDDAVAPTFDEAWLGYLRNDDTRPDASDEIRVLSYDEHSATAGLILTQEETVAQDAAAPADQPAQPPAPSPGAPPPVPPTRMGMGRATAPPAVAPPPSVGTVAPPPTVGSPPPHVGPPLVGAPPSVQPPASSSVPSVPPENAGRRQSW
jgi:hypothetical protein